MCICMIVRMMFGGELYDLWYCARDGGMYQGRKDVCVCMVDMIW